MAEYLTAIETRLVAILESARGSTGLGPDAAARYLPAGRYRRSAGKADLRDPAYPVAEFDRAYDLDWIEDQDPVPPRNPTDGAWPADIRLDLVIGFVYGADNAAMSTTVGSESTATNVTVARRRALGDAHNIRLAMTLKAIFQGGTDPDITDIDEAGPVAFEDLTGGRLLAVVPFLVRLWVVGTYTP